MTGYENEPDQRYRLMDEEITGKDLPKETTETSEMDETLKAPDFDQLEADESTDKKVTIDVDNLTEHVMMMDEGKPEDVKKDSDKKKKRRLTS